ncbi:TOG array regulator of axonemal microtubules 1 [Pelobates cultripes]|uniref:TOG array regulator of axonemal microtubules 1 n=1 Tax=Pelobates cultripes TaxID=61616 RepID=A0AAD1S8G8_PELCU|nr:TOG array regulator of axonemal microtubules 1 [Pelobates cultripes]
MGSCPRDYTRHGRTKVDQSSVRRSLYLSLGKDYMKSSTTNNKVSKESSYQPLPPIVSSHQMQKRRDFKVKGIQSGSQAGNIHLKLPKDAMPPYKESRISITAGDFKPSPPKEPSRRTAPHPKLHKVKMLEQPSQPPPRKASLSKAFKMVSSDEGRQKIEGLNIIQKLSVTKPQLLHANLKDIKEAVNKEVSNIRLDVTVAAINCLESLFCQLKSSMLDDQDECLLGLLLKAGISTSTIIRKVEKALYTALDSLTPECVLANFPTIALINTNDGVRECAAKFLRLSVERMGASHILCGAWDVKKKVLPAISTLVEDSVPEVRQHGLILLKNFRKHPSFLDMMMKYDSPENMAAIIKIIFEERAPKKTAPKEPCQSEAVRQLLTLSENLSEMSLFRHEIPGSLCGWS